MVREDMIVINSHNFNDNKNKLQAFSDNIPKLKNLPTVAESGGLFGVFGHNVKGEELNNLTEQIQSRMIKQNECIVKIIGEFNTIYKTFETLDTDYIRKITAALSSAHEANRKAVISINGLEKSQGDINSLISQQGQIIKVLSNFKAEIEKIKHIAEVDNIFDNVIIIQDEAEKLSEFLKYNSSEIDKLKKELLDTQDEQEKIQTNIGALDKKQKNHEEEINRLTSVDEQITNDLSEFKKESFCIAEKTDKKISENKALIDKANDHFNSELTAVSEKMLQQKNEMSEKIDALDEKQETHDEEINRLTSVDEQITNDLSEFKKESFCIAEKTDKKISENKALIDKTNDHFNSELTSVSEKMLQQKNEMSEKIDATKEQVEATLNSNINALIDEVRKEIDEHKENLNDLEANVTSNKEENDNFLKSLENRDAAQDDIIEKLEKEIESERVKNQELTVDLTKLTKYFKLFGIVSGSGIFILLVLVVLMISGVL